MDLDVVTKVSGLVVDLNPVVQELFESSTVEDAISGRTGVVDNKLVFGGGEFGGLDLQGGPSQPTEKRTQQSDLGGSDGPS